MSGGKDSTVVYHLCLDEAVRRGQKLKVMFIDQEAEWASTIDYIEKVMTHPKVEPIWLQVPIRLFNATSQNEPWLNCWGEGEEWMREKHPLSIKENVFGTDRFAPMFAAVIAHYFPEGHSVNIGGVRTEEGPARLRAMTTHVTYKGRTWGKKEDAARGRYSMYPVYDWSYADVWKYIHDGGYPYNVIYDAQYRYGVPIQNMRVSNITHETAVKHLTWAQELEKDTWNALTERLEGVNAVKQLQSDFFTPKELPFMFDTWEEYRDHLVETLITDDYARSRFKKQFKANTGRYIPEIQEKLTRMQVGMILVNDYHGTKMSSFSSANGIHRIEYRRQHGLPLTGKLPKNFVHHSHVKETKDK